MESIIYTVESRYLEYSISRTLDVSNKTIGPILYQFTQNDYSISRILDVSNKFVGPLTVRDTGPTKWFSRKGGQIVSFLKKMSVTMVGRRRTFLGLLCPRRPYIELFCVEQNVKIIINNTWNIPFFHFP